MNCPVCHTAVLGSVEIQPTVTAQKCSSCAGLWFTSLQFANWIDTSRISKPTDSGAGAPVPTGEPKAAKICAECGYLMTRYKVGHSLPFSLDRCGHCGGTWFDGHEWEALVSGSLRNQIHLIFSPAWQSRIRREDQIVQFRAQLAAKLGTADFAELNRIKAWLADHPHRDVILASLNSEEA